MELAIAVLCWTLSVLAVIVALILCGYLTAMTDLAKAKLLSEQKLH